MDERLSDRIDLETRIEKGEVERMTVGEVSLLVDDLWGPRAAMIRKLGQDYIRLLEEAEDRAKGCEWACSHGEPCEQIAPMPHCSETWRHFWKEHEGTG